MPGETGFLGRVLALDKVWNLNAMCVVGEGWAPGEVGNSGGALKAGADLTRPERAETRGAGLGRPPVPGPAECLISSGEGPQGDVWGVTLKLLALGTLESCPSAGAGGEGTGQKGRARVNLPALPSISRLHLGERGEGKEKK